MRGIRTPTRAWLSILAILIAGCGALDDSGFASDVERELDRGAEYASALVEASRTAPSPDGAIAVGYLERLRLGLGSPFRLIEYALQDPRLAREQRDRLAWSLLARTEAGQSYAVDPAVLTAAGPGTGGYHVELIEGAVRSTTHPDAGVLAVRLAYSMAAAERTVQDRLPRQIAQVAALVRDRVVARSDAGRLLRAAGDTDPLSLVTVWRVERRFEVEAPSVLAVSQDVEQQALELAPELLEAIRAIGSRPRGGPVVPAPESRQRPLLSASAARLLAADAARYDAPPQTPVAVAVETYQRGGVRSADGRPEWVERAQDRFFENAVNEERLAAEYALLARRNIVEDPARHALLAAAVGLRAYAQERPWFPGFGGPAARELEDRFGLASIEFAESTPAHWRPYYRRMLETSLSDLQRVLPSLDVRGLKVRFEARPGSPGTLAVHDPRTRTVYIPPLTGVGTLAHEIAHDLDWQTALRRYHVRGDYATDRAMRLADPRFAAVLRGLSAASLEPPAAPGEPTTHANRPAEVFARSVDWFVAVALAREGRLNGYLSSVQDDVLTGYGTVTPPDVTGTAGQALMTLLDDVAPVYPQTRRWFLESYGRTRSPTAYDVARRVIEASLPVSQGVLEPASALTWVADSLFASADPFGVAADSALAVPQPLEPALVQLARLHERLDALEAARDEVLATVDGGCRAVSYDGSADAERRQLIGLVARARARGLAVRFAEDLGGADARRTLETMIEGRSGGDELEPAVAEALLSLAGRVRSMTEGDVEAEVLGVPAGVRDCAGLPFVVE